MCDDLHPRRRNVVEARYLCRLGFGRNDNTVHRVDHVGFSFNSEGGLVLSHPRLHLQSGQGVERGDVRHTPLARQLYASSPGQPVVRMDDVVTDTLCLLESV
jgi:hypothetical protein